MWYVTFGLLSESGISTFGRPLKLQAIDLLNTNKISFRYKHDTDYLEMVTEILRLNALLDQSGLYIGIWFICHAGWAINLLLQVCKQKCNYWATLVWLNKFTLHWNHAQQSVRKELSKLNIEIRSWNVKQQHAELMISNTITSGYIMRNWFHVLQSLTRVPGW